MNIALLLGGNSAEREVSLSSGARVAAALRQRGHTVEEIDPHPDPFSALQRARAADVVWLALHGGTGEDGTVQAMLDLLGVPYTGSGHLASALAMDKDLSKHLFRTAAVPTADWMMLTRADTEDWSGEEYANRVASELGLPVVVKPSKQGSTVGLSIVKDKKELAQAVREAFKHDDEVMLEAFVPGRELTVSILGDLVLPVGEIIPKHEVYDYECKYVAGMADEIFPAKIEESVRVEVQRLAEKGYKALKLRGCARLDFRLRPDGKLFCLEANTLPGMTSTSLVPQAALAAGITFDELCERIALEAIPSREIKE